MIEYDTSIIEQGMASSVAEAVFIVAMLLFIAWCVKLAFEDL
jgi:hypothetical protein